MGKSANSKHIQSRGDASRAIRESLKDLPVAELMKSLDTSGDGLTKEKAQHRLEEYGYNEIEEKKVNPILKFLSYFAARTHHRFWSILPAPILLTATVGAQVAATFIAVYALLMTPLGWKYAGIVWGYCVVMFLIQDQVKLITHRIFTEEHSGYYGRHVRSEE
jgi:magnesium-transporting ATPase (P-type)